MKKVYLFFVLALLSFSAFAQGTNPETEAIKKAVNTVFEGMKACDSAMVKSVFAPAAILQRIRSVKMA